MSRTFLPLGGGTGGGPALLCLPHAGGSAASFRPFAAPLSGTASGPVFGVELPGRGARFSGEPLRDVDEISRLLAAEVREWASGQARHYVLLGHSLGALVAFEMARLLRDGGGPEGLIVTGVPAPEEYSEPARGELSRAELVAEMRRLGGTPEEVLDSDELIDLLLPVVRADLAAAAGYRFRPGAPLNIPILALAGADDPEVVPGTVAGWRRQTSASCASHVVDGNHFFIFAEAARVAPLVAAFTAGLPAPQA